MGRSRSAVPQLQGLFGASVATVWTVAIQLALAGFTSRAVVRLRRRRCGGWVAVVGALSAVAPWAALAAVVVGAFYSGVLDGLPPLEPLRLLWPGAFFVSTTPAVAGLYVVLHAGRLESRGRVALARGAVRVGGKMTFLSASVLLTLMTASLLRLDGVSRAALLTDGVRAAFALMLGSLALGIAGFVSLLAGLARKPRPSGHVAAALFLGGLATLFAAAEPARRAVRDATVQAARLCDGFASRGVVMTQHTQREMGKLAVIGAGNMGSGIAQKVASEGFDVVLVDLDDDKVARGVGIIRDTLQQGVERKIFKPEQLDAILGRVHGTADWSALADADLVIEAVFEDLEVKRQVFARLDQVCSPDAILATNTSSFLVRDLAAGSRDPRRVVGLHYFYHPAKNRLVEVVGTETTAGDVLRDAWSVQEQIGKTPIRSADASGFVVNRYFVPWLNEAVRMLEERAADIPTIEAACKETFGVGMGPFELMNVTGVPIALHAATTLGEQFGPLYAPADRLRRQVQSKRDWDLSGDPDASRFASVSERMLAVVFYVAAQLVDEGVGTIEDTDIGARVGLRWPRGPFQMMNHHGIDRARALVGGLAERWDTVVPRTLAERARGAKGFEFRQVSTEIHDGVATLTVNRPDAMNALNETVVSQLHQALRDVVDDGDVRGVVIAGAGKAFIAGADIRFFLRHMERGELERIVEFTRAGHELLAALAGCAKPVIARLHGLALGGGVELALACHRVVATPKATLAFPETGIGIYPGLGGTQRTPRRVGAALAKALIYTGRTVTATEAEQIGLVDAVVPHAALERTIRELIAAGDRAPVRPKVVSGPWAGLEALFREYAVEQLLAGRADTKGDAELARAVKQVGFKAPIALRLAERLIDAAADNSLQRGLEMELEHLVEIFGTDDAREGLSSLGRKRPEFKGR